MTPAEIYLEAHKKLNYSDLGITKPVNIDVGGIIQGIEVDARPELFDHIKTLTLAILKAEEEGYPSSRKEGPFAMHNEGYNQALEDHATFIREQIKEIEEI